jgi:hypothetical protein
MRPDSSNLTEAARSASLLRDDYSSAFNFSRQAALSLQPARLRAYRDICVTDTVTEPEDGIWVSKLGLGHKFYLLEVVLCLQEYGRYHLQ